MTFSVEAARSTTFPPCAPPTPLLGSELAPDMNDGTDRSNGSGREDTPCRELSGSDSCDMPEGNNGLLSAAKGGAGGWEYGT